MRLGRGDVGYFFVRRKIRVARVRVWGCRRVVAGGFRLPFKREFRGSRGFGVAPFKVNARVLARLSYRNPFISGVGSPVCGFRWGEQGDYFFWL